VKAIVVLQQELSFLAPCTSSNIPSYLFLSSDAQPCVLHCDFVLHRDPSFIKFTLS